MALRHTYPSSSHIATQQEIIRLILRKQPHNSALLLLLLFGAGGGGAGGGGAGVGELRRSAEAEAEEEAAEDHDAGSTRMAGSAAPPVLPPLGCLRLPTPRKREKEREKRKEMKGSGRITNAKTGPKHYHDEEDQRVGEDQRIAKVHLDFPLSLQGKEEGGAFIYKRGGEGRRRRREVEAAGSAADIKRMEAAAIERDPLSSSCDGHRA
uniref:Uncharacterized protein n=1 Tax=Oryza rufipogon TaxID=4529 RepID=A0A0E0NNG0_ORYRU